MSSERKLYPGVPPLAWLSTVTGVTQPACGSKRAAITRSPSKIEAPDGRSHQTASARPSASAATAGRSPHTARSSVGASLTAGCHPAVAAVGETGARVPQPTPRIAISRSATFGHPALIAMALSSRPREEQSRCRPEGCETGPNPGSSARGRVRFANGRPESERYASVLQAHVLVLEG